MDRRVRQAKSRTRGARVVLFLFIAGLLAYGAFSYYRWWNRVQYLQWLSSRNQALSVLGECIVSGGPKGKAGLPASLEELFGTGCLEPQDMRFRDPTSGVEVIREYRPVGSFADDRLIIMIERYQPSGDGIQVLCMGGSVLIFSRPYEDAVAADNALRESLGGKAIPPSK